MGAGSRVDTSVLIWELCDFGPGPGWAMDRMGGLLSSMGYGGSQVGRDFHSIPLHAGRVSRLKSPQPGFRHDSEKHAERSIILDKLPQSTIYG